MTDSCRAFAVACWADSAPLAALLLLALAALLRWALAPLRRLAVQIRAVERGEREQLGEHWPSELGGVVANLNTLLAGERTRIARYRDYAGQPGAQPQDAAGGVARQLRTAAQPAQQVNEQVDRMSAIVEHQLRRAATSGGVSVGRQAVDVLPVAQDLRATLLRVHAQKDFALELAIPAQVQFVGDRNDLTETLGNLMDNAAKWCRTQVRVSASRGEPRSRGRGCCLRWRTMARALRRRIGRGCWSAARASTSRCPAMAWAWPWCATWWSCMAAASA